MSYSTIMFSEASRKLQEKAGSRMCYQRMEDKGESETLTEAEADFISTRDSFYMATVGDQGFPYIQFRGGPKGFLKVLDEKRFGLY